jgi:RNA polymerase sigma-70 factor, ECF subfamily
MTETWILGFHRGDREAFESFYRDHFSSVDGAVGRILSGADKETVIHEVFCHVMASADVRRSFKGGSVGAWITTLARNRAIDFLRRRRFEEPVGSDPERFAAEPGAGDLERRAEARLLLERFRATLLPAKWEPVFEKRFVEELDQAEAARAIGISRTTLAYQEHKIRKLLRKFVHGSAGVRA